MMPGDFVAAMTPAARASSAHSGVPASFTVAEAALESGWGTSQLAMLAHNLFGVKADAAWQGPVLTLPTREYVHGLWVKVPARWRRYPDWQGCMADHAAFLLDNPRYHGCFPARDGESFAKAVAAAGYATDPDYADKLIGLMRGHNLAALDAAARAP